MPSFKTKFELSPNDMDLIESALRSLQSNAKEGQRAGREVNELLGRLHNQKIFYRPADSVYVSG